MTATNRVDALKLKHNQLDEELSQELIRPLPDELRIQSLKRKKLQVKDALAIA